MVVGVKKERISMATDTKWRLFKREEHVYKNNQFDEILKDAIRFFNGMKVYPLPPPVPFDGAGVYAIYCTARDGIYKKFGETVNRLEYAVPIYVGKAVSAGWRQSRNAGANGLDRALFSRLKQHCSSIAAVKNLSPSDFSCRFVIFEGAATEMIAAVEAALIKLHNPLWNSVIDGFGNHDPGGRRTTGKIPQWDVLHPGRAWAMRMTGEKPSLAYLKRRVADYLVGLR